MRNAAGTKCYYVYANGKIVEDTDIEQNGDQVNGQNSNADNDAPVDSNADTDTAD